MKLPVMAVSNDTNLLGPVQEQRMHTESGNSLPDVPSDVAVALMAEAAVDCVVDQDVLDCAAAMAMEKLKNAVTPNKGDNKHNKPVTPTEARSVHDLEFHSAQHAGL